jgi:hypothetical protein
MSVAPVAPPTIPPTPRYALGLPAGSVRALHTLLIVGLVCALLLIPGREGRPTPIRPYLIYLLLLAIGHFFAAHGNTIARADAIAPPPLHLPAGLVRALIMLALVATVIYKLLTDYNGLVSQLEASVQLFRDEAYLYLPFIILAGFFVGVVFRWVTRGDRTYWGQDLQAWVSLVSVLLLAVDALIRLVVETSLPANLDLPTWESILAGVVAFYFGERS